jgi:two-component system phosphate regulon sensor histidine kinase PhoR
VKLARRMGLRRRMVVVAVAASAVALVSVLIFVGPALRRRALAHERETLTAEARLMAHVVDEALARGAGSAELDPLIDDAAREVRARVTIVAPDGRVLADSAASGAELAAMENHGSRPEILEALEAGSGTAVRRSATTGEELMYAAVAIRRAGVTLGFARVSFSLHDIEAQVRDLQNGVVLALLLAFGITVVLSAALSSSLTGPLGEIMEAARRLAAGDLTARIRVPREDELGELATILNDAADQLQARVTELARDRARTEAILSAMEEGVLAADHKGVVRLANDVLRRHFDLVEPIGRHYLEVIRHREVGEVLEGVLADGERRSAEITVPHRQRVFAVTGVRFPGLEGMPDGVILTFHDTTERRRLDRVRRDFVANASHELRTPLTSIRGFVEALEDGAVNDPELAARFLGKIHAQAERMAVLADDLLELSRLESDEGQPTWSDVAPGAIAAEVRGSFVETAAAKGVALESRDEDAGVVVTDADRLRRILENLVDNAVKYTDEGDRVEIVCRRVGGKEVVVEVRDTGPGISAEHLPRIFERFYRVDKARSRELGGTGLGLAIVKHLAEGMGAQVTVTSEVGRGSSFFVHLPSTRPVGQSAAAPGLGSTSAQGDAPRG